MVLCGQLENQALPDDQKVKMMCNILTRKGDDAVAAIKKRIAVGQGIEIKGHSFSLGNLQEAVAWYAKSLPGEENTPNEQRPNNGASGEPVAEPFEEIVKVTGDKPVAILRKPCVLEKPIDHLAPGQEVAVISRAVSKSDGRVYVRLKDGRGWMSTRSRKDFSKVVISLARNKPGQSIDPNSKDVGMEIACATNIKGSPQKKKRSTENDLAPDKETYFRVMNAQKIPILREPNLKLHATAHLNRGAVLAASEVSTSQSDGRVYLKLADHRGWVCVTSRADFGRAVVHAITKEEFEEESQMQEVMKDDSSVVHQSPGPRKIITRKKMHTDVTSIASPSKKCMSSTDGIGSPSKLSQPAKIQRKLEFAPDEAVVFRSDAELWPKELGAPRPLRQSQRQALRRAYVFYVERAQDAERDMEEAQARADSYKKSCAPQKSLLNYVAQLKNESQKLKKEWAGWIEKELAKTNEKLLSSPEMREDLDGVAPVQVRGQQWFCAVLTDRHKEPEQESTESQQHFGPLRQTVSEAKMDHKQLLRSKESGLMQVVQPKQAGSRGRPKRNSPNKVKQKEDEDEAEEEEDVVMPKKRLRVMKDMGEEGV